MYSLFLLSAFSRQINLNVRSTWARFTTEEAEVEHAEYTDGTDNSDHYQTREKNLDDLGSRLESGGFVDDTVRAAQLQRQIDLCIFLPCVWLYLLNYLDRGNIGKSKNLNEETGDSPLRVRVLELHVAWLLCGK